MSAASLPKPVECRAKHYVHAREGAKYGVKVGTVEFDLSAAMA